MIEIDKGFFVKEENIAWVNVDENEIGVHGILAHQTMGTYPVEYSLHDEIATAVVEDAQAILDQLNNKSSSLAEAMKEQFHKAFPNSGDFVNKQAYLQDELLKSRPRNVIK